MKILTIFENLYNFWEFLKFLKIFTFFYNFENFWQSLQFLSILTSFDNCRQFRQIIQLLLPFDNWKDNPGDLWHLRHWLQFWQLRTWIHGNLCYLTIKSDTGQHSQFLQCFRETQKNTLNPEKYKNSRNSGKLEKILFKNMVPWGKITFFNYAAVTFWYFYSYSI